MLPEISRAVAVGHASSTTDLWTDDFKKVSYITMTVHYIDSAWKLNKHVIFTCNFPDDQRKTGANIEKELIRNCSKFGLETDQFKKLRFVTDRGANIIKALGNYERFSCSCHVINTVLAHTFCAKFLAEQCPTIQKTIIASKTLVTYMKQSGYVNCLKNTLHQQADTRWCSHHAMFQSISSQYSSIEELLDAKGESHRLDDISHETLKRLITLLEPFVLATRELEADDIPTQHIIIPWYFSLMKLIQSRNTKV